MAVTTYAPAPASATIEKSPRGQLQRLQKNRFIALFRRTWEHIPFALWFKGITDYSQEMTAFANPMATWRRVAL